MKPLIAPALFIAAVALANVITAATDPFTLGPWLVTWGTLAAAATFVLRDVVHWQHGRAGAYYAIAVGLVVAAYTSAMLDDTLAIVVASAAALGVGSALDTEVFARLRARVPERVLVSGVIGGTIDTVVFVVVGLSPLWSGIVSWAEVPAAIIGVALVKAVLQGVGAAAWLVVAKTQNAPQIGI